MELYTFAYITGILELLFGIPLLLSGAKTAQFIKKFMTNDLAIRTFGGVIVVICALALLNDWSIGSDTAGLIRLVAWLGLIKGVFASWWPEVLANNAKLLTNSSFRPVAAIAVLVIGVFMLWGATLV
ncbi:hypothetical protein KJ652_04785 [Patescibacteria group bacterium]|nr:hypothetical protein [Patescibacteria group bacterium]MBU1123881.1 hypothetical protein [Patescibacteria group bacterium]MBU1910987.1 hypothetical protein [Patescibacteria group bacterium]